MLSRNLNPFISLQPICSDYSLLEDAVHGLLAVGHGGVDAGVHFGGNETAGGGGHLEWIAKLLLRHSVSADLLSTAPRAIWVSAGIQAAESLQISERTHRVAVYVSPGEQAVQRNFVYPYKYVS